MNYYEVERVGGVTTGVTVERRRVNWALGENEVAELYAVRFIIQESLSSSAFNWRWMLWKKSDIAHESATLWLDELADDDDIVAGGGGGYSVITQGMTYANKVEDLYLKYPLIFVRPSQILILTSVSGVEWGAFLYYRRVKTSRDELSRLLVKNHS